jgi:ferredoxin-NADP reductase
VALRIAMRLAVLDDDASATTREVADAVAVPHSHAAKASTCAARARSCAVHGQLRQKGVADHAIHDEVFGPDLWNQ